MSVNGKRYRDDKPTSTDGEIAMTPEEELEAKKFAELAARAEARAAEKAANRTQVSVKNDNDDLSNKNESNGHSSSVVIKTEAEEKAAKFLTKADRERLAMERLQQRHMEAELRKKEAAIAHERFVTGQAVEEKRREARLQRERDDKERERRQKEESKEAGEHDHELKAIREHYLGQKEKRRKVVKPSEKFAKIFQFDWEEHDDTGRNDMNPLYNKRLQINSLFGRGYIGGIDLREQRKQSSFLNALSSKRLTELMNADSRDRSLTSEERRERERTREYAAAALRRRQNEELAALDSNNLGKMGNHWTEKKLEEMTERDWRIFREDFDIRVTGGRATLPLRYWEEGGFPEEVMRSIRELGYEKPSPIQRQAIPIGLAQRDIIGIAETGSGKTAAFVIPLLTYISNLPPEMIENCADDGPLAIVMAPTRELAMQIEEEFIKLARYTSYKSVSVVGGQSIEDQGFRLRRGVEVVIGTPGRMVDCVESNYMVLNQCNYVVLDEADRMIDMGFEPQVVAVLDAMGGTLKDEDEEVAEQQVKIANEGKALFRITAMFSATMPPEVERIARKYLRHPATIKIGDQDSGKNKRIEQHVQFLSEGQKKSKIVEELRRLQPGDKVIVFVNAKKHADVMGRQLEGSGFSVGVLHGGRSQDQREDTLEKFRSGDIQILVATDVAGRGLDIPDVTLVVNYDMPNKIENYCHRIGRTGRAGKTGTAITFVTDSDTEVMFNLKQYLESTGANVPQQLAKHPAAQAAVGTRDDKGKLVGSRKDQIVYSKK